MSLLRAVILAVVLAVLGSSLAAAASLPANQRFTDAKGQASLLTRPGGKGYVTARTRCGSLADQRVRIARGRISTPAGTRIRVSGIVTSNRSLRLTIRRGSCTARFSLKRVTAPQ